MDNVFAVSGDITRTKIPVDAIVALYYALERDNWVTDLDKEIKAVAGERYHVVPAYQMAYYAWQNTQVIPARGNRNTHKGNFNTVLFVIDTFESPLNELVYAALLQARSEGFTSLAIPLMRIGTETAHIETNINEVIRQTVLGVNKFVQGDNSQITIYIVVNNNPSALRELNSQLNN